MSSIYPAYKSMRLIGFDYSQNAIYFTTICCNDRINYFGEIRNGEMNLNQYGEIVKTQIEWLNQQYSYCIIHNYVVMPNHVHILLEINSNKIQNMNLNIVGHGRDHDLQNEQNKPIKIKSLSELMGAFKTTSSKQIHLNGNNNFSWQTSFHDHIVRSFERYKIIDNYINENPKKWNEDKFKT